MRGRDESLSRVAKCRLAVTGCDFELLDGIIQPFLMGRGDGLKLDTDPVRAGPAYNSALDQNWGFFFRKIKQEIHLHSGGGSKGTFEPTAFQREIQRLTNLMEVTLMDEGAEKRRWKSGMLSYHHNSVLFCGLAAGWTYGLSMVGLCRCNASWVRSGSSF